MADLFLSYAREDRECAELLARALAQRGWSVWWDRQIHVGRSFSEVIERELSQAKCVIVLWSKHSLASDWVQNEAAEALHRKSLVPVRIEDVRPPLEFRRLQTADLIDWRKGFNSPDFEACITAIEILVDQTGTKPIPTHSKTPRPPEVPPRTVPQQTVPPPPRQQPPPQQHVHQQQQQGSHAAAAIPNYLIHAVLVTALCCPLLGIVAIVYSTQVNSKLAAGDFAGAREASNNAKLWMLISLGLGAVVNGFFLVMFVAASFGQY